MKKILTIAFAITLCIVITGCGKVKTEDLTKDMDYFKTTVKVPEGQNYKFVDDVKNKPKYAPFYPSFVLEGDKVTVYFEKNSYTYQTYKLFEKEYPDMDKNNPNLKDMKVVAGHKGKIFRLNGYDALRIDYRYGEGNGKLVGYNYLIDTPNIKGKGYMSVVFLPTNEKDSIKDLMEQEDVKVILDSIKIIDTEKK